LLIQTSGNLPPNGSAITNCTDALTTCGGQSTFGN
jgi:hypothetical protein